jgi:hypothetical protein
MSKVLKAIGTAVVALAMLGGGALVLWNVFGMGSYGETCHYTPGCKSYYCVHHELVGSAQMSSGGRCTKSCDEDGECGEGAKCVELSEASRDDLPPYFKPRRACLHVRELPPDVRR